MTASYITAYTGMVAPPYVRTFFDRNTGVPLNLTGATFTAHLQNQATGAVTSMSGVWTAQFPLSAGVAQYQWTGADLTKIGTYSVFVSATLPADTGPREFDPDVLIVIPSAEYLAALIGGIIVGTDINVAGLGAGGSTPITTNLPADVIDRIARQLGHVIVDTLPTVVLAASTAQIGHVIVDSGTVAPQVGGVNVAASNPLPTTSGQVGLVAAYGSNASTTGITTDTPFKWGAGGTTTVQRVVISNETGADVRYEFDAAATANSLRLKDGNVLFVAQPTAAVHFYTAASQNINQAGGVMIRGYN